MNLDAEVALLSAVRTRLIEYLALSPDDIDIELDDLAPAMAGQTYYAVSPAGAGAGRHSPGFDQSYHWTFGCRVTVLVKATQIARDRRRTVFLDKLKGINRLLSLISKAIHFDYSVMQAANAELAKDDVDGSFHKPLVATSIDARPATFSIDPYGSASGQLGDPVVGIKRGIIFTGAEFFGKRT